jgi:hypothetical protein
MICSYFFFVYRNIDDECSDGLRTVGTKKYWLPLLNYIISGIRGFFSKLEFSQGFLYISLIAQDTPPYFDFSLVFFYILFAGRISEAAM